MKNYRPVSLRPIFSKIFEKVIFNSLLKYLDSNNLLASNQSGFRPGSSCVHQLTIITKRLMEIRFSWIYQKPFIEFGKMV